MGRKRDTDRLGHVVLKYNAVETARIINGYKNDLEKAESSKLRLKLATNALEEMLDTMKVVGSIMSKAESAKMFAFSDKDADEMTITDICKDMEIDLKTSGSEPKEDVDAMINEAAQEIAKKMGINPDNIVVGKIGGSSEMLNEMMAVIKKHKGNK